MHRRRQQGKEPLKEKSPNIDSVTRPLPQLPVAPGSAGGHPRPRGSAMATALEGCGWLLGLIPLFSHRSRSITVPAPFALRRDAGAGKRGQVVREGGCETLPKTWRTETSQPTTVPTARGCLGTSRVGYTAQPRSFQMQWALLQDHREEEDGNLGMPPEQCINSPSRGAVAPRVHASPVLCE